MQKLFTPYKIGDLNLKNRLIMAPMCMYSADTNGCVQPFHFTHYPARALGGVALVIQEATAVEARGRISLNDLGLYDDAHIPGLTKLVDAVHQQGSHIAIQLAHAGRKSTKDYGGSIAPSAIPFSQDYPPPVAMTRAMIAEVIAAFRQAARRAKICGYDGVEIHAAHGYLIHEFLSPLSNHRTDAYGGNLEKRTQFLRDILHAVREEFGKDVWLRVSAEEYVENGNHVEQTIQFLQLIQPYITAVNVSSGGIVPAPIKVEKGYQLTMAKAIQQAGFITIAGGLITSFDDVNQALETSCEFVYLGRELLLNPFVYLQWIKQYQPQLMVAQYKRG
jgi:NADPH2 dehydrogenase